MQYSRLDRAALGQLARRASTSSIVKPPPEPREPLDAVDLVVCLPVSSFHDWWDEGGTPEFPDDDEYDWVVGRKPPDSVIPLRSRLYVVCGGMLRGFAPILRTDPWDAKRWALVRDGRTAEAVTIEAPIRSFRGWRYRWWSRQDERPFTDWAWEAVPPRP